MSTVIMTDSNCDIPYDALEALDVEMIYMPYYIDGRQYTHDMGRGSLTQEFFDAMRSGKSPTTSQVSPAEYWEYFEPILKRGDDIVFICMSSALSGTFNNAHLVRTELLAEYPGRRIEIVDSRGMSVGMAAATERALALRDAGAPIGEIVAATEENILTQNYLLTVDDLKYLQRSGRLTAAAAFFGSILSIKPIIRFDYEGRLVPTEKVKGRKQVLRTMARRIAEEIVDPAGQTIRIAQADAMEDSLLLKQMILEAVPDVGGVTISFLGPVIAAHVGPGSIGLIWFGKKRMPSQATA